MSTSLLLSPLRRMNDQEQKLILALTIWPRTMNAQPQNAEHNAIAKASGVPVRKKSSVPRWITLRTRLMLSSVALHSRPHSTCDCDFQRPSVMVMASCSAAMEQEKLGSLPELSAGSWLKTLRTLSRLESGFRTTSQSSSRLLRDLLADLVETLPSKQAQALLDRIVVIDPFSTSSLVPMQVLKPDAGMRPEEQAFEVTTIINRMGGADLGIRQDDYTYHLVLLGITTGRTLPAIASLLSDPVTLTQAARTVTP